MSNLPIPAVTVTLNETLLFRLEEFVRSQAAYMNLPDSAGIEAHDRARHFADHAAVAVVQHLIEVLPQSGLGPLETALAEAKSEAVARVAARLKK